MFSWKVNDHVELRLFERQHSLELFKLIDSNREHLLQWHPWVNLMRSASAVEKAISVWQHQYAENRGFYAGIWFDGQLCGSINHLNVDWVNRSTALSYWLAADHQRKGIMTGCCRAFISHAFDSWELNRITIECGADNTRSRAIPERLGFKLEGITRGSEWLGNHYVDHAIYGLISTDLRISAASSNERSRAA